MYVDKTKREELFCDAPFIEKCNSTYEGGCNCSIILGLLADTSLPYEKVTFPAGTPVYAIETEELGITHSINVLSVYTTGENNIVNGVLKPSFLSSDGELSTIKSKFIGLTTSNIEININDFLFNNDNDVEDLFMALATLPFYVPVMTIGQVNFKTMLNNGFVYDEYSIVPKDDNIVFNGLELIETIVSQEQAENMLSKNENVIFNALDINCYNVNAYVNYEYGGEDYLVDYFSRPTNN